MSLNKIISVLAIGIAGFCLSNTQQTNVSANRPYETSGNDDFMVRWLKDIEKRVATVERLTGATKSQFAMVRTQIDGELSDYPDDIDEGRVALEPKKQAASAATAAQPTPVQQSGYGSTGTAMYSSGYGSNGSAVTYSSSYGSTGTATYSSGYGSNGTAVAYSSNYGSTGPVAYSRSYGSNYAVGMGSTYAVGGTVAVRGPIRGFLSRMPILRRIAANRSARAVQMTSQVANYDTYNMHSDYAPVASYDYYQQPAYDNRIVYTQLPSNTYSPPRQTYSTFCDQNGCYRITN